MAGLAAAAWWTSAQPKVNRDLLKTWPRVGMSIATLVHNPKHQLKEIVKIYRDSGVTLTRINLCSASWTNPTSYMPFERSAPDGPWDLFKWDQRYYDRLVETRERMNAAGIVCQWTFLDLRNFSHREDGNIDQTYTPWRYNVNGVFWEKADTILYRLPEEWCWAYAEKAAPMLDLEVNPLEPVNEGPEKGLHIRIMEMFRKFNPKALVSTNRNEDTPTQYRNMKIGKPGSFDLIAFHGLKLKQLSDLDRVYYYLDENGDKKPLSLPTFRKFLEADDTDPKRVIFSSDGARISDDPVDTYDYPKLREFFREVRRSGCSIEHQSRAKMTPTPSHHMIEADWFESVIA